MKEDNNGNTPQDIMNEGAALENMFAENFSDGAFEPAGTKHSADKKNSPQNAKKARKSGSGAVFLIVVAVIAVLALVYGIVNRKSFSKPKISGASLSRSVSSEQDKLILKAPFLKAFRGSGKYIANLYITGVIEEANENYNQEWLLNTIEELRNDADNLGILLVIDSPGGTVYQADEAYLALQKYKNSGKEVWAYFKSLAASGGYYIACSADAIYANRNTLTGSIGVIAGASVDATGFLEKLGIKSITFTAGKNKNMLNYNSPLTEEQRAIMQSVADECYDQFTSIVASARRKSIGEVKLLADGRIYTAGQAKRNGLIDSIDTLENAQQRMLDKVIRVQKIDSAEADEIEFLDYEYVYNAPFMNRMFKMFSNIKKPEGLAGDALTGAALETLMPNIKYPAYLYRN